MKIRLSIRYYFLAAMLLLGSCIVIAFSVLTANYFTAGRDSVLHGMMVRMAETAGVSDGHPAEVIGFQISSRWQDLSPEIQQMFVVPASVPFQLEKKIDDPFIFAPPKAGYFVMHVVNAKGEKRYVANIFDHNFPAKLPKKGFPHFAWIAIFGLGAIAIFSLLLLLIMRTIAAPVESLRHWARSLNEKNLQQSPPDFGYKELNTLAQIIHRSLHTVQESLDREHEFLRYASHELRTPIAVIRTNVELLRKINEREQMSGKQKAVVERIERAGFTMSHLTETLLWLSRDNQISPALRTIQLNQLVLNLTEELHYLLQGKSVEVQVKTSDCALELPETACRIVLTNLIRNAYQHTQSGLVSIVQNQHQVSIQNVNSDSGEEGNSSSELGFGLGLKLTEKLIRQFNWQYHSQVEPQGHKVEVTFS
ncbi:sensor histidine kinase [Psychromonas sp.]|uniref:sensor histidine kinase n=1 Tax=Psychromonas sp. TaxID=1884585 RepID=UPI00356AA435